MSVHDMLSVNNPLPGGLGRMNMTPFNGGGAGGGFWGGVNNFLQSDALPGAVGLGSLALNAYGLNKSLGFAEDQLGIMKDQENRAATAQNYNTGNSLAMALQRTTPGTPEHERVKQAMAQGTYQV